MVFSCFLGMVSQMLQNSTTYYFHSTKTFIQLQQKYLFNFNKNNFIREKYLFNFNKNNFIQQKYLFNFNKNNFIQQKYLFNFNKIISFNKNIYSTSTKIISFNKNIYSTSTKIISFKIHFFCQQQFLQWWEECIYVPWVKVFQGCCLMGAWGG